MEKDKNTVIETAVSSHGSEDGSPIVKKRADDALNFVTHTENLDWTPEEERRIVRKIDSVVLSLLFVGAAVGYADGQAFGFAAIFGLIVDMKLYVLEIVNGAIVANTDKYSFAAAIFQLGAVFAPLPFLALAQFFSYGRALGIASTYTGLLAMLTIVCTDYGQILAVRFFYGFSAIVSPLAIIVTSMWWKTDEQPIRVGGFIAGSALGNLIGQAVDLGAISITGGVYAASPWKWIYIILGSIAMGYGVLAVLIFPASPMKAWFLNDREKAIAVRRLASNNTGIQTRSFKFKQMLEAFLDPQMYLLAVWSFAFSFCNGALGSFGGLLVKSFGYTAREAIILSMPVSAIAVVTMLLSGILGTRFPRSRIPIAIAFILPSIVGNVMLWKGDRNNVHILIGGLYISATFYGALIQAFALIAANNAGHTKKTVVNAFITVVSNLGGFAGPFAYHASEELQNYPTGQKSALSLLVASVASFIALIFYYKWRNARKAARREANAAALADPNIAFKDLTDQENPAFVYVM